MSRNGLVVLVTGGLGYIGSHTVAALAAAGHEPVVIDNLANSSASVLPALERLCGRRIAFHRGDIRDAMFLRSVLAHYRVQCTLHFAALKSVAESARRPLDYYDNNVAGTTSLLRALESSAAKRIVFSSSATVYGEPVRMPISEAQPAAPIHAYGRSKRMVEQILADACEADSEWTVASLRYFNPAGAHESGLIGERPSGTPDNLMPFITQVATGERDHLDVFGGDYPTRDGTGERDYVHVMDVAEAHVCALSHVMTTKGFDVINLGTGRACSVLEVVRAFEHASGHAVPYRMAARRTGDVATCYADVGYAEQRLGWRARRDLNDMCRDAARYALGADGQRATPRRIA